MLKRQIMKKVFEKEFNADNMRNQILLKKEREKEQMKKKIYRFAVPVCSLVIICSMLFFTKENSLNMDKNRIHVNELEYILKDEKVLEVEEVEIESIPEKFNFIWNGNIPKTFKLERKYNLYTRSNLEKPTFDILRDYVLEYKNEKGNKISISFSEVGKPLRDYQVQEGKLSKINDTDVNISYYKKMYIVRFKYQNIYFDIEAENISLDELTLLLKTMLK